MRRYFIKGLVIAALMFVLLTQVAATGTATALAIASVVGAIAPFVLKLVPVQGSWMLHSRHIACHRHRRRAGQRRAESLCAAER